ncbi:hypothetical protein E3A20_06760 [Planctomyces bekefii]|uniref:PilZ domain-containing protein n=1 Tax=Planctomyces bekefii TaxID=1653850 RepID=A0A5C6M813_9PLAN|nr:hypothetical protein E3A20_06760 [Planctomyces bekefii]
MGLFSKIASAIGGSKTPESRELAQEIATLKKEGRMHARHVLHAPWPVRLELPGGTIGRVRDMSYGGLGVIFEESTPAFVPTDLSVVLATLHLLDQSTPIRVSAIHWSSPTPRELFVGIQVQHEVPASLLAMKSVIEPLGWGGSMIPIGEDIRNERYRGPGWHCYRGEGPTDVVARLDPQTSRLMEALITFRHENGYRDVRLLGDQLATSEPAGSSTYGGSQMANTSALDPKSLRSAACILLSLPESARLATAPLLQRILSELKVSTGA